ncbi:hypothetical protein COOONC_02136 [Cooperia oncophora]
MYILPKSPTSQHNVTWYSSQYFISIKVQLMNAQEQPLRVLYSRGAGSDMVSVARTAVIYHNKTPHITGEVKLRNERLHYRWIWTTGIIYCLLFITYLVKQIIRMKRPNIRLDTVGCLFYVIIGCRQEISTFQYVSIVFHRSYGYLPPDVALPNVRWLDGHKPVFSVSVRAISTVHPQDEHLERFLVAVNSLSSTDRRKPPASEIALITAAQNVIKARPEPMVAFMYNVLDKLIALIANRPYSDALSSACFETLGQLVKICTMLLDSCLDMHGRSALLTSYIHYYKIAMKESKARSQLCKDMAAEKCKPGSPETQKLYHIIEDVEKLSAHHQRVPVEAVPTTSNKAVHEELAEQWVRSGGCAREMAFLNAWFFLELMIKSMAEYLSMTGRLYLTRRSRFSERFVKALDSLSCATIAEVVTRLNKDPRQAVAIANSWAFFVSGGLYECTDDAGTHTNAAASLYLLMRESFESGSSLARVKMQITMSLSTLVSNATREGVWLNEDCLRRSLKTVLIYSETDANTDPHTRANSSFSEQVKDLVCNIHMILSDTVKLKEFANDFEMTIDLMYRVAKGYQTNPDLRLTWLLNMASRHADRELYCEAGQCMLHAAALAAGTMTTSDEYMPRGAVDFEKISDNILEERAVGGDVLSPDVEGICESRHFTAAGLVILVEKCAAFFEKAHMYEMMPDVFRIVEPIIREWRDYRRLSTIYARLSDALARIEPTIPVLEDAADIWTSPLMKCVYFS